jgi:choline monooxygenase
MNPKDYFVHADIRKAETLPGKFYHENEIFEASKTYIFLKAWHWIGDDSQLQNSGDMFPVTVLPGYIDEPLIVLNHPDKGHLALSNVCTHRGNLLIKEVSNRRDITCSYHGRRFALDGSFQSMPEFQDVDQFPRICDSLAKFSLKSLSPFLFVNLKNGYALDQFLNEVERRVGFMNFSQFQGSLHETTDYKVNANWAIYTENYLEGFHIPYVHPGLNEVLDFKRYATIIGDYFSLQVGPSRDRQDAFDLPPGHIDYGKQIGAYYFWLFPNLMLNFYPWGLSVNIVSPQGRDMTMIKFMSYVLDPDKRNVGAGADLGEVEYEDEQVVESVQKGMKSRFYPRGRYSPSQEKGVHHFHRLLYQFLFENNM